MKKCIVLFLLFSVLFCSCLDESTLDISNTEVPTPGGFENITFSEADTPESASKFPDSPVIITTETEEKNTEAHETTVHIHDFSPATCTGPEVCKICGETRGDTTDHIWTNATCTSYKTCSVCGKTEGEYADHIWKDATCTSPRTCSACGKTEGYANGHSYYEGKCNTCGAKDPDYVPEVMVWIPTNGGTKYHSKSSCSKMIDPAYVTKSYAISQGFDACGRCY